MKVVLDTNIFCRDYRLKGTDFRTFLEALERTEYSLYIPKVVIQEVINKYEEQVEKSRRKIERELDNIRRVTGETIAEPITEAALAELASEYESYLRDRLDIAGAQYLDYPAASHEQVARRAMERRKPFKENGAGYRDTLIWEAVLELAASGGTGTVAFVSANTKDFAENGGLHGDLLAEVDTLPGDHSKVIYHRNLEDFNDRQIRPLLEELTSIRDQLASGEYEGLELTEFVKERFIHDVPRQSFAPDALGLPNYFENLTLEYIEKVKTIENIDVRRLTAENLLIDFSVVGTCGFDFRIRKEYSDLLAQDMERLIWDEDWDETHMAGVVRLDVIIEFSLIFETDTELVSSAEISSVRHYASAGSWLTPEVMQSIIDSLQNPFTPINEIVGKLTEAQMAALTQSYRRLVQDYKTDIAVRVTSGLQAARQQLLERATAEAIDLVRRQSREVLDFGPTDSEEE